MNSGRTVVHITMDYPDAVNAHKTAAIRNLIELTRADFDHRVWSFNRITPVATDATAWLGGRFPYPRAIATDGHIQSFTYTAPPLGIQHFAALAALGRWIARRLASEGPLPALLVGHKVTVEGIAVATAAGLLGVPYALSVQGNTDTKILSARPDLTPRLRRVWQGARCVFPFTPWALEGMRSALGDPGGQVCLLPCATDLDRPVSPKKGEDFVSVFHLANWRMKNLRKLIAAGDRNIRTYRSVSRLGIVGGGDTAAAHHARRIVRRSSSAQLEGDLSHGAISGRLNRAVAMVLPSRRESFGMVFIEALFAGCPIIYPAGRAVDGYFDGAPFALRVDPRSVSGIAEAMLLAERNEMVMKGALARWQTSPDALRFTRPMIAAQFKRGLLAAIASDGAEADDWDQPSPALQGLN